MNDLGIRFSYPVPDCPGLPEHSADAAGRWPDVENRNSVALPIAAAIRDIQINLDTPGEPGCGIPCGISGRRNVDGQW